MDKAFKNEFATSINLLGASFYAPINEQDQSEVLPYLKQAKLKKFLSKQDRLAIIGFANLLNQFKGDRENLLKKSGLYLCVGYIPFEENTIRSLAKASQAEGAFSMDAFSSNGISSINPLTTFKCLPNMPAYHITSTFDLQGTSFTTYPGTGQLYQAIEMAMLDLEMNKIDYAFVGAVCDQDNFLVKSFHNRINQNCKLIDAAGFCCLTNQKLINEHSWVETPWELKIFRLPTKVSTHLTLATIKVAILKTIMAQLIFSFVPNESIKRFQPISPSVFFNRWL
jgi:hypothetical protein